MLFAAVAAVVVISLDSISKTQLHFIVKRVDIFFFHPSNVSLEKPLFLLVSFCFYCYHLTVIEIHNFVFFFSCFKKVLSVNKRVFSLEKKIVIFMFYDLVLILIRL